MQEKKFIVWNKLKKTWLNNCYVDIYGIISEIDEKGEIYELDSKNIDIFQYIGIKDDTKWDELNKEERKKWIDSGNNEASWRGKNIYRGSIVRILYSDWISKSKSDPRTLEQYLIDISSIGKIVYNAPTFEIKFKYYCKKIDPGAEGFIKVIGHEAKNPKLLKEKI